MKNGTARRDSKRPPKHGREIRIRRLDFDLVFPLCYVLLYAVVLYVLYHRYFPIGDTGVESDFYGDMAVAARELVRGNFSVAHYPYKGPVYPFVLAAFYSVIRDWYRSGVILNIVFSAAGIALLYRLVRAVLNRRVAVCTAVSVSLVFEFFLVAHKASSDMLFFFLCVLTMERIIADRVSRLRVCGAAIAASLAFLTRYNGVFLAVAAVVTLLAINPGSLSMKRRIARAVLFLVVFAAVCAPWFFVNHAETGEILPNRNLENLVEEFYGERETPEGGFSSVGELISYDAPYFVGHYLSNIPKHFWKDMNGTLGLEAGLLVIFGLLRLLIVPPTRKQSSLYLFAAFNFLLLCFVFHLRRFSITLAPAYYCIGFFLLFGSGATALSRLGRGLRRVFDPQLRRVRFAWSRTIRREESDGSSREAKTGRAHRPTARSSITIRVEHIALFVLLAVLVGFQVKRIVTFERMYYGRRPLFVKQAAEFLRRPAFRLRDGRRPVLMARKPHLAFYADMQFQYYPNFFHGLTHFLSFAMERDVDYIVYSGVEKEHFPEADFLATLDNTPGIEKIYGTQHVVIYRTAEWLDLDTDAGRRLLSRYETDLAEAEAEGDIDRIVQECFNISGLYAVNGEWEKKVQYLSRALRVLGRSPDPASVRDRSILLELNIAEAHLFSGDHDEGVAILERLVPEIEAAGLQERLISAYILLSKHYEALGRWKEARRRMMLVRDIYLSEGNAERAAFARRAIENLSKKIR